MHCVTPGHDIVFGAGEFRPGATEGRRLVAHELTHAWQAAWAHRTLGDGTRGRRIAV